MYFAYYDENGFRYKEAEIKALISGNTSVENARLNSLVRNRLMLMTMYDNIRINMHMRGGKPISSSGKLDVLDLVNKVIYVLCEDSSSGYTLYQRLLEYMYPNVVFKFSTSKGNSRLSLEASKIMGQIKGNLNLIIIADYKRGSPAFRNNVYHIGNSAKEFGKTANIWLFRPTCVEEVILSNVNLKFRPNTLTESIKSYLRSGKLYCDVVIKPTDSDRLIVDGYMMYNGKAVENLEALLANELSKLSYIRYTKKNLSNCFVNVCCPRYLGDRNLPCKFINKCHSGCESFTNDMSLACGLQNIVDNILGKDASCLKGWNSRSKYELYRRL